MLTRDTGWSTQEVRKVGLEICSAPEDYELVSLRGLAKSERRIVRYPVAEAQTVIVKLWARPDLKTRIKKHLGIASVDQEWKNLNRAQGLGLRVPAPLGHAHLPRNPSPYTGAMVCEDLGPCTLAVDYVKACLAQGAQRSLESFDEELLEMTATMVRGGLLDSDHGLINVVVDRSCKPVRLDFEMARHVEHLRLHTGLYARMLGHLLLTYTFAVQPDTERTELLAARLLERLAPAGAVLEQARSYLERRLEQQAQKLGLVTRVALPW